MKFPASWRMTSSRWHPTSGLVAAGLFLLTQGAALGIFPETCAAMSSSELSAAVRSAAARSKSLAGKTWNSAAEKELVGTLDRLAGSFHELLARGTSLPKTAQALTDLLASNRLRYTSGIEKMQADVIRIDGDLEAVQDSAAWRESELYAARLLYRLNWVRYENAVRYLGNSSARKKMLREARDGFTELAGASSARLKSESLFGRGLANTALGEHSAAARDLEASLKADPNAAHRREAEIALGEALIGAKRHGEALTLTERLARSRPRGGSGLQMAFLRAKAILAASTAKHRALSGSSGNKLGSEAAKLIEELHRSGGSWRARAVELVDAGIDDPAPWAATSGGSFTKWLVAESLRKRGSCKEAIEVYAALKNSSAHGGDAAYGTGYCLFHTKRYKEAGPALSGFLASSAGSNAQRREAAYLRFKSAEILAMEGGLNSATLEKAIRGFLEIAPEHPQAFEANYRLGEVLRERGSLAQCAEAFTAVRGDAGLEGKAAFFGVECRAREVLERSADRPASGAETTAALEAVDGYLAANPAGSGKTAAAEARAAKALLLGAALAPRVGAAGTSAAGDDAEAEEPGVQDSPAKDSQPDGSQPEGSQPVVSGMAERLRRLEGFEDKFPDQGALLGELFSLRVVAYRSLGDLDSAGSELRKLLALGAGSVDADSLRKLGLIFLEEASRREENDEHDAAREGRRTALAIYERLLELAEAGEIEAPVESVRALVEDLKVSAGSP